MARLHRSFLSFPFFPLSSSNKTLGALALQAEPAYCHLLANWAKHMAGMWAMWSCTNGTNLYAMSS